MLLFLIRYKDAMNIRFIYRSVEIRKVNVDQNQELAQQFGVRSIPALFFIKDEEIVDRIIGMVPERELRNKIDSLV